MSVEQVLAVLVYALEGVVVAMYAAVPAALVNRDGSDRAPLDAPTLFAIGLLWPLFLVRWTINTIKNP